MTKDQLPLFLTVTELSDLLQIGMNKAYELVKSPEFPAIKFGHKIIIPTQELFEWVSDKSTNSSWQSF